MLYNCAFDRMEFLGAADHSIAHRMPNNESKRARQGPDTKAKSSRSPISRVLRNLGDSIGSGGGDTAVSKIFAVPVKKSSRLANDST